MRPGEWRPVQGWPGYTVSDQGEVRGPLRLLKPRKDEGANLIVESTGARKCRICKNENQRRRRAVKRGC